MPPIPDAAIGNIAAAFVAGLVALLGLIISKENKVSEFRQAWIDQLRSEVSLFIAHVNAIQAVKAIEASNTTRPATLDEQWKGVRDDFVRLNQVTGNIRMRLNGRIPGTRGSGEERPGEGRVLALISEIESEMYPGKNIDYMVLNQKEKELVQFTKEVLDFEWGLVKGGEQTYRTLMKLAWLAIIVSASVGVYYTTGELISIWKAGGGPV